MHQILEFSQDGGITEILVTVLNFIMRKTCILHKYLISNITFNFEMSGVLTSYICATELILYFLVNILCIKLFLAISYLELLKHKKPFTPKNG